MKRTINEIYEELKRKRDNAKIELNKVYELSNDFLKHFDIKSGVDIFIKNSRLVGEVNAYAYVVALIEESGVLEDEKVKDKALELACRRIDYLIGDEDSEYMTDPFTFKLLAKEELEKGEQDETL